MAITITDLTTTVKFDLGSDQVYYMDKNSMSIKKRFGYVHVYGTAGEEKFTKLKMKYSEVTSPAVASNDLLITTLLSYKVGTGITVGNVQVTDGTTTLKIEPNGSMPVTLQDQTTPSVISRFSILEQSTTTTGAVAIGDYVIPVTSATGIVAGKALSIFDPTSIRFSLFHVVSIASLNVTVDTPLDFAYPSGSYIDISSDELAVNGSVTPVVAGIRNNAGAVPPPGVALSMDVTRIMIECLTATAPQLDEFGDIAALTNGVVLRRRNQTYHNILNVKTMGQIKQLAYDVDIIVAAALGQDGFYARLTFAGQDKMGVVQRININEDLEVIIQDNLTGLTSLKITAEGSIVQP